MKTSMTLLASAVLLTSILVIGAGAVTYSLPDVGVESGQMVTTDVEVSDLETFEQAAFNMSIDYDPTVVSPGTVTVDMGVNDSGNWISEQNILTGPAPNTSQLRIVVYHDPTTPFVAPTRVLINIPWTADGAATPGDFSDLVMSDLAVSDPLGANISGSTTVVADGGRISVLGAITPPVFANFDLSPWEVFGGGLPWTLVDGFSEQSYPYLNVTANGVVPIEISSSSDGTADGWQGFSSGSNRVTYASDTVYVARFNVRVETSDAPGIGGATVNDFPVARFRFLDFALNSAAEMFVDGTSVGMADTPPGGGLSQSWTFEVFFEPSDVSANNVTAGVDPFEDLFLEFDMFDFLNDKQGHIILDSVEVATLVKSEVDAQFSTVLDVSNFQDDSQIILGLPGFGFDQIAVADPNIGLFRIEGFDSVTRNVNDIVVSTPATFAEASPPVDPIGALQEFGTPVATATPAPPAELRNNKTDVVWRQVVTASSADPVNTSEIRLRITDAFGRTASHYFVFRQLGRMRGDATGINRPDADGETYFNYFTYPENSNVASLIGDPNTETIQGLVGLVDFTEPSPPQAQGPITFSEFRMETAPRNRLLP